jgi:hypothetical protein
MVVVAGILEEVEIVAEDVVVAGIPAEVGMVVDNPVVDLVEGVVDIPLHKQSLHNFVHIDIVEIQAEEPVDTAKNLVVVVGTFSLMKNLNVTIKNDQEFSRLTLQILKRKQHTFLMNASPKIASKVPSKLASNVPAKIASKVAKKTEPMKQKPKEVVPKSTTIEISNLSRATTESDITTFLKRYGKIEQLIFKNTGGIFNGRVMVTYRSLESGSRIVSELDGVVADGLPLRVREIENSISIVGMGRSRSQSRSQVVHQDVTAGLYSERI